MVGLLRVPEGSDDGQRVSAAVEFLTGQFTDVERGFAQIDRRFSEVGSRFEEIDRRFTALERRSEEQFREILGHFDELYRRLGRLESEYFAIVQTLRRIETLVGSEQAQRAVLQQSVVELRRQIADLQVRLDAVEDRLQG
jgi:chromosome segregation ATPase